LGSQTSYLLGGQHEGKICREPRGVPGLLGAHALEGLNLGVDLVLRELVPARAHPAASAA
jgi:hypothetical protein